jgi:hypothetical protein
MSKMEKSYETKTAVWLYFVQVPSS